MTDSALDRIRQWEVSGGSLRVLGLTPERAVVQLCACTGEPMEQVVSDEPALLEYLRNERTPPTRRPRCVNARRLRLRRRIDRAAWS